MNNLVANFDQVLDFAGRMKMPLYKKRGILREYLQSKFIAELYGKNESKNLVFVGGTSLRLLRDMPRFSEDLDFDNHGLEQKVVVGLIEDVVDVFKKEDFKVELKTVARGEKTYFELKFLDLLKDLGITTNDKEKLKIKIDYANYWQLETETVLMNKYGFVEQVVTNKLSEILQQKLTAYSERKQVQPRDMYDVVWIFSQQPLLFETKEIKRLNLAGLFENAVRRFEKAGVTQQMKNRLRPFLFSEEEVQKLEMFEQVIKQALR